MVAGLRQVNIPPTCQNADKIVETIPTVCSRLNAFYVTACEVTKAADEMLFAGEDLTAQQKVHDEHLEMFLMNFDELIRSIDKLINDINSVREIMGTWWQIQEEVTTTWFFFHALNKTIVERRNWHLEALSTIVEGLVRSRDGLIEIRERFANNPEHMVNTTLRGKDYYVGIRDGLVTNEAMALGWWKSFDEERQLITGQP
jgi:hypothetical protein